jgi:hypothetical protein
MGTLFSQPTRLFNDTLQAELDIQWSLFCQEQPISVDNNPIIILTGKLNKRGHIVPFHPKVKTLIELRLCRYKRNDVTSRIASFGSFLVGLVYFKGQHDAITVTLEVKNRNDHYRTILNKQYILQKHVPQTVFIPWSLAADINTKPSLTDDDALYVVYGFINSGAVNHYRRQSFIYTLADQLYFLNLPHTSKDTCKGLVCNSPPQNVPQLYLLSPQEKKRKQMAQIREELLEKTWAPERLHWVLDTEQSKRLMAI